MDAIVKNAKVNMRHGSGSINAPKKKKRELIQKVLPMYHHHHHHHHHPHPRGI
jgi:hypothetical protein